MQLDLNLWHPLIVAAVPLAIAMVKKIAIPKQYLPVLAAGLGIALQSVEAGLSGGDVSPVLGLALGAGAVFVRELLDQFRKRGL